MHKLCFDKDTIWHDYATTIWHDYVHYSIQVEFLHRPYQNIFKKYFEQ